MLHNLLNSPNERLTVEQEVEKLETGRSEEKKGGQLRTLVKSRT